MIKIFIDKQKLERTCLDELTKLGNLFETVGIDYCVFGEHALLAHGIKTRNVSKSIVFSIDSKKEKMLEILFKMNYTIHCLKPNVIKVRKNTSCGDIEIKIVLGNMNSKKYEVNYKEKDLVFGKKIFSGERLEVWGYFGKGKSGKGYFRVAPLEEIYFSKMNSDDKRDINDLEIIKGSGKIDLDRLFKIFKKKGLV